MVTVSKRRVVAVLALTLLLLTAVYAWGLFFTSGTLQFTFVRTWGESGAGPGQFDGPIGVAVGPNADIYVTDAGNNRIQRFRPDGTFVAAWGEQGSELGQLDRPMHLVFGPDGHLYVAEYFNDRIQAFTPLGEALGFVGTTGSEPGAFDAPGGVAIAPNGSLYVADFYNHRAQHLRDDGSFVATLGTSGRVWSGALHYPHRYGDPAGRRGGGGRRVQQPDPDLRTRWELPHEVGRAPGPRHSRVVAWLVPRSDWGRCGSGRPRLRRRLLQQPDPGLLCCRSVSRSV